MVWLHGLAQDLYDCITSQESNGLALHLLRRSSLTSLPTVQFRTEVFWRVSITLEILRELKQEKNGQKLEFGQLYLCQMGEYILFIL